MGRIPGQKKKRNTLNMMNTLKKNQKMKKKKMFLLKTLQTSALKEEHPL
jgi:hypothetical protein